MSSKFGLVLLLLILGSGLAPSAGVIAFQGAEKPRFPDAMETDIPAIALYSYAFGITGMLGIKADLMGVNAYAELLAAANGEDPAHLAETLEDARFVAHVAAWSGVPSATVPDTYDTGTISMIAEYEDAAGAETGYDLAVSWITGTEEVDAPEIGDQSILMRTEKIDPTYGLPTVQLDYAFRVDNYVGVLTLAWFGDRIGDEYDAGEMAELADVKVNRMEEADNGASALPSRVLRLEAGGDVTYNWYEEMYDARDGEYLTMTYDDPAPIQVTFAFWEDSGIDDAYRTSSSFLLPDGTYGMYITSAYDLGRARAARSWIEDAARFLVEEDVPGGYQDFGQLEELPGFDVDVAGMTYSWEEEAHGMRVWFQVDGVVYGIQADGPNGIDEDVFFKLIEAQIACAEDEGYCEPIPVPDDLYR